MVYKTLNLIDYGFSLFTDQKCNDEVRSSRSTVAGTKFKHGDIVYYKQMAGTSSSSVSFKKLEYISPSHICISFFRQYQAVLRRAHLKRQLQLKRLLHR
jgi:hypothetical protein